MHSAWKAPPITRARAEPEQATKYFPPVINILNIQTMTGSQIQQGTSGSTQTGTFSPQDFKALAAFVEELKGKLPELGLDGEDMHEAQAEVGTLEVQLSSNRPKPVIVRESLHTLRNLLEGATASAAATLLLPKLLELLRHLG
jgi:hypothetical protein